MGKLVLTNVRHFLNGADLTGDTNKVEIDAKREDKDTTTYGSAGWRERLAGILQADVAVDGFFEAGALNLPDDACFAAFAVTGAATVCPAGAADQALGYLSNVEELEYSGPKGSVGDAAAFSAKYSTTWPLLRGVIAVPPTALAANGTGTANQLGALAGAGNSIYAALHVVSVTLAPTVTVAIQSAPTSGFASPTTRLTFTAATALGGQILRAAGPVTDTWWRANWTFSGTGSALVVVSFGVY